MAQQRKRIAVIGAGASGLAAIYCCKEENLDVVCFDKTDHLGGLWFYRDSDIQGQASVMLSTLMNTSKEMSAYSTFPPPKEFANYMHNSVALRYIEMYAEKFDLEKYIRFRQEVIKADRSPDFDETGKWILRIRNHEKQEEYEDVFDGVMICTGHHVQPSMPEYPGQETFKGQILHSHSYKKPDGFENKKIVVVGTGNSGCDAAAELGGIANKVYLSTRKGCWVQSRLANNGLPYDISFLRRSLFTLQSLLPFSVACTIAEKNANSFMDHSLYKMKPKHRILSQHPTINDLLPSRILGGLVTIKGNIKKFTPKGVIFENEEEEHEVDVVIMATGYKIVFPFLEDGIYKFIDENRPELYKFVFPPRLKKHTIAFIGLIQPLGPIVPASEMQSRWFCALMNKKTKLPTEEQMLQDIKKTREKMVKRFAPSPRHTMETDWIAYMDNLASNIGAKPNLIWLAMTDPRLWSAIYFGPSLPYQYRLTGLHPWPGAREAILTANDRIRHPFETRILPEDTSRKGCTVAKYILGLGIFIVAPAWYYTDGFKDLSKLFQLLLRLSSSMTQFNPFH